MEYGKTKPFEASELAGSAKCIQSKQLEQWSKFWHCMPEWLGEEVKGR